MLTILKYLIFLSYRNQQKNRKSRGITRKRVTSLNSFCTAEDGETDTDALSIAETETVDDEFYDCSDEELEGGGGDTENGFVAEICFVFFLNYFASTWRRGERGREDKDES